MAVPSVYVMFCSGIVRRLDKQDKWLALSLFPVKNKLVIVWVDVI